MQALNDFHVTRLEWAYITDREFIERVRASGRVFGGAASAPAYRRYQRPDNWEENDKENPRMSACSGSVNRKAYLQAKSHDSEYYVHQSPSEILRMTTSSDFVMSFAYL